MNTLVVGGSGFLSGAVARTAVNAGHKVWTITRGQKPLPKHVIPLVADRDKPAAFAAAIAGAATRWGLVVDCIGYTAEHASQDLECFARCARQLVFVSSDFALEPTERPWKVDETYDRFNQRTPYARGKREAEVLLSRAIQTSNAGGLAITILRPCHIYGPGSELGCLPLHARDTGLIERLRRGEPLRLVGGGHFLQQPVLADDLATMILSCANDPRTAGEVYMAAGPDIVSSWEYYQIIAELLETPFSVVEVPITDALREHPEYHSFCCHRVYSLEKAMSHGLRLPGTPLRDGLRKHLESKLKANFSLQS